MEAERNLTSVIVLETDDDRLARRHAAWLNGLHRCDDWYVSGGIHCLFAVRKRPSEASEMARLKAWMADGCKLETEQ